MSNFKVSQVGRKVTPLLSFIRDLLRQTSKSNNNVYREPLRYEDQVVKRTQPLPCLPDGPSNKLSDNAYCGRDGRRFCMPPENVYNAKVALAAGKAIESGTSGQSAAVSKRIVAPSMPRA
ncbi:NADH dehydrogenase [ubiquinone] 1 alpha subcomplex subunit 7-like [Mytilus californianus]|uniref:NADH dehydrogenase [ubiquinone] 1 alpha subcomplex subunit 7-like n=1 Tax=Mytilus californianus TaxID=6549 RepID=UPI0022473B59|nr:NADH dehydrogenase [ubiquinone] 1 alpha subcomplex subunit 7-like [Mytilus californianus]